MSEHKTADEAAEHLDDVLGDAGAEPETLPAVIETPEAPHDTPPRDLQEFAMTMPVPEMVAMLREFTVRRTAFRTWVKSVMVEGVHFGWTPGTKPKVDSDGNYITNKKQKDGTWKQIKTSPKEHTRTQSLLKPGAELLCETFGVRPKYVPTSDVASSGSVVILCELYSRDNVLRGEGHGAHEYRGGADVNRAIKMAEKRALVNAVLDTFGLSDLFTQDEPGGAPEPRDNPTADANAAKAPPRAEAVDSKLVTFIVGEWKIQHGVNIDDSQMFASYRAWVVEVTGREFNPRKTVEWTKADAAKCCEALGIQP